MNLYIDTSVLGGYFEKEFEEWSVKLINEVKNGTHKAVISEYTIQEVQRAPIHVIHLLDEIMKFDIWFLKANEEVEKLAGLYLKEKIVSKKFFTDALHIAIATVNKIDVVVSWNFKHIVHLDKIRLYNGVNLKYGYSLIEIRSPRELV